MRREDLNRALEKAESFTEAALLQIIGFPKPFTFVTVIAALALAWAAGKFL